MGYPRLQSPTLVIWPIDGTLRVLPLQAKVNMGIIAMKRHSIFLRAPELDPYHQIQLHIILRIIFFGEGLIPMQGIELVYSNLYQQGILSIRNIKKEQRFLSYCGYYLLTSYLGLRDEQLSLLILLRREGIMGWQEVNKRPYWFMCECKKKGVRKASPYAGC